MYRSMTLFRNLLTPLPCNVKDAARLSHDDIVEIYGVRIAHLPLVPRFDGSGTRSAPCCAGYPAHAVSERPYSACLAEHHLYALSTALQAALVRLCAGVRRCMCRR